MAGLDVKKVSSTAGALYVNLAYGGGTIAEAVDTYWWISKRARLDEVYIEMGLINFNAGQGLNRVPEAISILDSPLLYLTNRLVIKAALLAAYSEISGSDLELEKPSLDKETFWRFQVNEAHSQVLSRYVYPLEYERKLEAVAADCRKNQTRLTIIIPPTHMDLQRGVAEFGLTVADRRFRAFVSSLGVVYDFDYPNPFTEARDNFSDPFHFTDSTPLIEEIWGKARGLARRSSIDKDNQ